MKNSMKQINKRTALCAAAFLLALLTLLSACREEPVVHSPSEDVTGASAADAVPTVTVTPSGEASETPAPTPSDTPDPPTPTETSVPAPTPTPTPTPSLTVVLPPRDDAPVITEVMPHNNKYPVAGVFTGYVEFYNPHSQPVTLSDFSLCDTPDAVFAALPSVTLESGRYAVVAAGDLNVLLSRQGKTRAPSPIRRPAAIRPAQTTAMRFRRPAAPTATPATLRISTNAPVCASTRS